MPTVTTTVTSATAGTTTTVTTTKATPAPAPAVAAAAPTYAPFVLQYFDVMAKGLGPTLVAEHSGLAYKGNTDKESRVNYKTVSPFMQQPVLIFDGLVVSQTVAIMNYIGRKAGKHMEGETDVAYANSQMFIAEAEDLYAGLLKYFATIGRPCRCTTDEKAAYWAEVVPKHFACLEKMVSASAAGVPYTVGELYLYSMLHQIILVSVGSAAVLAAFPTLLSFYEGVEAHPVTQKVLAGTSNMGVLRQYFQTTDPESK